MLTPELLVPWLHRQRDRESGLWRSRSGADHLFLLVTPASQRVSPPATGSAAKMPLRRRGVCLAV